MKSVLLLVLTTLILSGCSKKSETSVPPPANVEQPSSVLQKDRPTTSEVTMLMKQAKEVFGVLPPQVDNPNNPITQAKIELGKLLYYDVRLSKNQEISCNTCHDLEKFGIDARPESDATSLGHKGQKGTRNSPTVYNAALHMAQFWDGRAADVEEQAEGPVLNPVEMALPDEASTVNILNSIPGYRPLFQAAFTESSEPVSFKNMAHAIGAFERKLMTPAALDHFIAGRADALDEHQQKGLSLFIEAECVSCHSGPAIGGGSYHKLGSVKPYASKDQGRFEVTKKEEDRFYFKSPSLRNIEKTAPYLHDGSIATLEQAIQVMAEYQTSKGKLGNAALQHMLAFLTALTGQVDKDYIKQPTPLPSGPNTPKPNPSS